MYEYPVDDPESEYLGDRRHLLQQERHLLAGAQPLDVPAIEIALGDGGLCVGAHRRHHDLLLEARQRGEPDVEAVEGPGDVEFPESVRVRRMRDAQGVPAGGEPHREAAVGIGPGGDTGPGAHRRAGDGRARRRSHDATHRMGRLLRQERAGRAGHEGGDGERHQQPREHRHPSSRSADTVPDE